MRFKRHFLQFSILLVVLLPEVLAMHPQENLPGINRLPDTRLRVVCYNGYFTSIFPTDKGEIRTNKWMQGRGYDGEARLRRFAEWAPRAHADIWAMQEIIYTKEDMGDTTAEGIGKYFSRITGQSWHAAADGQGRIVLSKYPILWSGSVKRARGMAALIDLPHEFGRDLLLINLHFFTKPKEVQINMATRALEFIEAVQRGEYAAIPEDTPIMICGDFNSTETERPYHILAKLDRDAQPDDSKAMKLRTPAPKQLNASSTGTYGEVIWQGEVGNSAAQLPDRRIDHILPPMDFLKIQQTFALNSLILPEEMLTEYGISRDAILLHRDGQQELVDHLPVILDLK